MKKFLTVKELRNKLNLLDEKYDDYTLLVHDNRCRCDLPLQDDQSDLLVVSAQVNSLESEPIDPEKCILISIV